MQRVVWWMPFALSFVLSNVPLCAWISFLPEDVVEQFLILLFPRVWCCFDVPLSELLTSSNFADLLLSAFTRCFCVVVLLLVRWLQRVFCERKGLLTYGNWFVLVMFLLCLQISPYAFLGPSIFFSSSVWWDPSEDNLYNKLTFCVHHTGKCRIFS